MLVLADGKTFNGEGEIVALEADGEEEETLECNNEHLWTAVCSTKIKTMHTEGQ